MVSFGNTKTMKRSKKHSRIKKDYDKQKRKHLEKLSDKMLENDERNRRLKEKKVKGDFLKNF